MFKSYLKSQLELRSQKCEWESQNSKTKELSLRGGSIIDVRNACCWLKMKRYSADGVGTIPFPGVKYVSNGRRAHLKQLVTA